MTIREVNVVREIFGTFVQEFLEEQSKTLAPKQQYLESLALGCLNYPDDKEKRQLALSVQSEISTIRATLNVLTMKRNEYLNKLEKKLEQMNVEVQYD